MTHSTLPPLHAHTLPPPCFLNFSFNFYNDIILFYNHKLNLPLNKEFILLLNNLPDAVQWIEPWRALGKPDSGISVLWQLNECHELAVVES